MLKTRQRVAVMGAGFVGAAMGVAAASAPQGDDLHFDVVVVDLPNAQGMERVAAINSGRFPFVTSDEHLQETLRRCVLDQKNLSATVDQEIYATVDVLVVDVHLDVAQDGEHPAVDFTGFRAALYAAALRLRPGTLVIVETTVPPGTCERVALPEITRALAERGLPAGSIHLAHSYERVMPGPDYLRSITHFWRVYAGIDEASADLCEAFLRKIVDAEKFPLTRLHHTTASELGKVLENSYRATNIAFIEEWSRFAEAVGVDIFSVIDAIRMRPTHNNLRQPGFGVGGYCLVKDPCLGEVAARQLFPLAHLQFPFADLAIATNRRMPLVSVEALAQLWPAGLSGKKILLLGVSYRSDVGDTRFSPAEIFYRAVVDAGAEVVAYDPMVEHWAELDLHLPASLPSPVGFDAVVFSVAHREFLELDHLSWLGDCRPAVLDTNRVLSQSQLTALQQAGLVCRAIGRGDLS